MVSVVKLTDTPRTPGSWRMLFSIVIAQLPQSMPVILICRGPNAVRPVTSSIRDSPLALRRFGLP